MAHDLGLSAHHCHDLLFGLHAHRAEDGDDGHVLAKRVVLEVP